MHEWQNAGCDVQPLPLRHATDVHTMPCAQLVGLVHTTSHAHDWPQVTFWHESVPVHCTSHGPVPHSMPRHELEPLHVIAHDSPPTQLTPFEQLFFWSHSIVQ